jgi:hypothetical protein
VNETCSVCGTTGDAETEGWSFAVEGKRLTFTCNDCARTHIRAIEGKLPEEYW